MEKEDLNIVYSYIGYSDGTGAKKSNWSGSYPELPDHVLLFFTSINTTRRLPEVMTDRDNFIRVHNSCYGRKMTRQQVIDFAEALDDEYDRRQSLQKIAETSKDATFMLVVEDRNSTEAEKNENYMDKQLGRRWVEDCIHFQYSVPMCSKQFHVHEPEVELGYFMGALAGIGKPFFAKLWRSKQSGSKYVSIVFGFDCEDECEYKEIETDDEAISVLRKSGLDVIGIIRDANTFSHEIQLMGSHGIFRYSPDQSILHYSCYLCKDREGSMLFAYTTEVTEPYEDEPMKTRCNLDFIMNHDDSRTVELLHERVEKSKPLDGFMERFQIVKEAIDQWDKIGLLGVAPSDEYDGESEYIAAIIKENSSAEEIAEAISHVFSLMFWNRGNSPKHCIWPANLIREEFDMKYFGVVDNSGRQKLSDDKIREFTVSNGWIYYESNNDGGRIKRIRIDGTEWQIINDEMCWDFYLEGDWLYYIDFDNEDGIIRIRTDGTGMQRISGDYSSNIIHIKDGWIYHYVDAPEDGSNDSGIYKMRTDGSGKQKLCVGKDRDCKIDGNWLYYTDYKGSKLFKIRTDGTENSQITDDSVSKFFVNGAWVYFNNSDDNDNLYRIRVNGSDRKQLTDFESVSLDFSDGWIYYQKLVKEGYMSKRMGIHKMRPDGSEQQSLIGVECDNYIVDASDGWVYFSNKDDGSTLHRMHTDGTDVKKLNNDISDHIYVVDEWIYYLKGKYGYPKIYRIPVNGITVQEDRSVDQ